MRMRPKVWESPTKGLGNLLAANAHWITQAVQRTAAQQNIGGFYAVFTVFLTASVFGVRRKRIKIFIKRGGCLACWEESFPKQQIKSIKLLLKHNICLRLNISFLL